MLAEEERANCRSRRADKGYKRKVFFVLKLEKDLIKHLGARKRLGWHDIKHFRQTAFAKLENIRIVRERLWKRWIRRLIYCAS